LNTATGHAPLSCLSRRDVLSAGALGLFGLGLSDLLAARAAGEERAAGDGFGRAKRCILLFMWGGPSQLDTFDLKPDAPAEVRGQFQPIATKATGVQICEHFGHLAQVMDKVALVRSLGHDDPAHLSSAHTTLTGHLAPVVRSDAEPPSSRDWPHVGSVVARVRPAAATLPSFVTLPWICSHPAAPGGQAPGQNAGWLGRRYAPLVVGGDPNAADWRVDALRLRDGITPQRMDARRELLRSIDAQRAALAESPPAADLGKFQQQAFALLASGEVRQAFDLAAEPEKVRERYGRNLHGQCVLLARRLVEHGVPLVSVNWHNDGKNFWDTHGDNFNRLKNDLIPPADRALAALLGDLAERALLDSTLVCWVGEFGRKPQITANNAGREHWPFCYSGLLAGAGIRGGAVWGRSDARAMYPADRPTSPQDYAATVYHALGIRPETALRDQLGRPIRLCEGKPLVELFG